MAVLDFFRDLLRRRRQQQQAYTQAQMLQGVIPIFSQFGDDVYASDVVQACIDCIATECSKLQPRHIRTDNQDMRTVVKGSLNRLFKFAPNELMTTRDFLEKIIWLLYLNYNAFIYPTYDIVESNGVQRKEYTGLYPLKPVMVEFLQDETNTLFVRFTFKNGQDFIVPYSDVIHLRKKFSMNEIMGGGFNGYPDNKAILKTLEINDTVLQGLDKAVKTSMAIRGILKVNTILDDAKQEQERLRFEQLIKNSESGILPIDLKGDYQDIKIDPKFVDKDTLEFLESKILKYYGVPLPILSGDFTDEQYEAFYEKTLEPIIISLGQAFSKALFTRRELDVGNEIVFYHRDAMYMSTRTRLEIIKVMGEQGLLTDDQKLKIMGYPPIPGGNRRTMSLNYIDVNLANEYQLKRAGITTNGEDEVGDNEESEE